MTSGCSAFCTTSGSDRRSDSRLCGILAENSEPRLDGRVMMTITSMPDDEAVREALRRVDDPEAGMNIVDLGLVYGVEVAASAVHVDLTMTTAACPMAEMITDEARDVIASITPPDT